VAHSITADSRGRIYVADRCGRTSEPPCTDGRLQIFDGEGTFLAQWTPPGAGGKFNPFGVRVDNDDRLYVLDGESQKVWVLDTRNGNKVVGTVEGVGGPSGHHVAVNPRTGGVYTVELMLGIKHFARSAR
jgi:streptogramin lyase